MFDPAKEQTLNVITHFVQTLVDEARTCKVNSAMDFPSIGLLYLLFLKMPPPGYTVTVKLQDIKFLCNIMIVQGHAKTLSY